VAFDDVERSAADRRKCMETVDVRESRPTIKCFNQFVTESTDSAVSGDVK
jgi:hypothetical protein